MYDALREGGRRAAVRATRELRKQGQLASLPTHLRVEASSEREPEKTKVA
jgi:hypothetical protein